MNPPTKHILIVDDDNAVTTALKLIVERLCEQCRVTIAGDGVRAMDVLDQNDVDLVLTDYEMPGVDGLELAKKVRNQWPKLPLFVMTGSGDTEWLRKTLEAHGIDDLIHKPFGIDQLTKILQSAISEGSPC
jgi:CheY-like chemotaxis protein